MTQLDKNSATHKAERERRINYFMAVVGAEFPEELGWIVQAASDAQTKVRWYQEYNSELLRKLYRVEAPD